MGTRRQLGRPNGVIALARHSHRVLIAGDTNSHAKNPRGVPRKPHHHMRIRASTTTPRPAAAAAGKFNSSTTHLRAHCGGLGYAPSHWALRVREQRNEFAHQSNFPAACAAPQPCAFARSESVLKQDDAQGCGSAYASGRGWWWWEMRNQEFRGALCVSRSTVVRSTASVARGRVAWCWGCKGFRR